MTRLLCDCEQKKNDLSNNKIYTKLKMANDIVWDRIIFFF